MKKHQMYFNKRLYEIKELPDTIFIESYMGCNLHCKMCPVPGPEMNMAGRKYSGMSFETYKTIIDQLSDRNRLIRLNQLGEPLLNIHLVDFVSYAASNGHRVELTTNGTRLNEGLAHKLLIAGLKEIIFSFDGCTQETYENIRIGADYFEVLANIEVFSNLNKFFKNQCEIKIHCIISDLTFPHLEQISAFWEQRNIQVNFIPLDDWSGKLKIPAEFGPKRTAHKIKTARYPCHLLWTSMAISSEGNVMYCCHDYKQLSGLPSIKEKPLREIWNSELKDIRAKHVRGVIDEEPCRTCNAWMTMPEFFQSAHSSLSVFKSKVTNLWAHYADWHKKLI